MLRNQPYYIHKYRQVLLSFSAVLKVIFTFISFILLTACIAMLSYLVAISTVKVFLLAVQIVFDLLPICCSKHFSNNYGVNFLINLSFCSQTG